MIRAYLFAVPRVQHGPILRRHAVEGRRRRHGWRAGLAGAAAAATAADAKLRVVQRDAATGHDGPGVQAQVVAQLLWACVLGKVCISTCLDTDRLGETPKHGDKQDGNRHALAWRTGLKCQPRKTCILTLKKVKAEFCSSCNIMEWGTLIELATAGGKQVQRRHARTYDGKR